MRKKRQIRSPWSCRQNGGLVRRVLRAKRRWWVCRGRRRLGLYEHVHWRNSIKTICTVTTINHAALRGLFLLELGVKWGVHTHNENLCDTQIWDLNTGSHGCSMIHCLPHSLQCEMNCWVHSLEFHKICYWVYRLLLYIHAVNGVLPTSWFLFATL